MSATHTSGRSNSRASGMPGYLAMPSGVVLTMPSAARTARAVSSAARARPVPKRPHRSCASRSERARVGREIVEQRNDRLFARMGDVETGEAEAARRREKLGQRGGGQAQRVEIDDLVDIG